MNTQWRQVNEELQQRRKYYSVIRIIMKNKLYCFGGKYNKILNDILLSIAQSENEISTIIRKYSRYRGVPDILKR